MRLVIGNKNYSSWSMRPWVLMKQLDIPFEEEKLRLDFTQGSAFRIRLGEISPVGKVPVLLDGELAIWDTLAITEYLAEKFPGVAVWPRDTKARARARSLCAEMHSGFGSLRSKCPMNIEASLPAVGMQLMAECDGVSRDLARITAMWSEALQDSGGPYLFGEFSAVDAFYAPVVARLRSYALPVPLPVADYMARVWSAPGVAAWVAGALAEQDWIAEDEPYRQSR